jgi:hypothetical protein
MEAVRVLNQYEHAAIDTLLSGLGKRPSSQEDDRDNNKKARMLGAKLSLDTCCNMACRKPVSDPHLCAHCLNKEDAIYCSPACRASDANQHKALCMLHVNYSA